MSRQIMPRYVISYALLHFIINFAAHRFFLLHLEWIGVMVGDSMQLSIAHFRFESSWFYICFRIRFLVNTQLPIARSFTSCFLAIVCIVCNRSRCQMVYYYVTIFWQQLKWHRLSCDRWRCIQQVFMSYETRELGWFYFQFEFRESTICICECVRWIS